MDYRIAIVAAAFVAVAAHATPMSREAYKAQELRIEAEYDAAQARCKPLKGNARDVCNEQVRGVRDIQQAELALQYKPTADNDEKLRNAKAEAIYAVSLQKCKPLDGNAREVCRKDAKAVFAGAKAEAKLQKDVVAQQMRSDGIVRDRTERDDKVAEAQFNAARERCEMLPAEGRDVCLQDARRRFGKL
ncbi:hypothetical protein LZ009_07545 [Ramlibacter sp. XY19]|uniref:hypothetical protein n=1 Tax=Ramlibacter paludis TaxID=2908000 RepID=UPI0023DB56B2|nr:hypothetical protein [Ramlibacter paludis]MCG2592634.1 hypothetical protein [Ramlibacter paludis]